jgi:hypothetical protein
MRTLVGLPCNEFYGHTAIRQAHGPEPQAEGPIHGMREAFAVV